MRFPDLQSWLTWMESQHPRAIELGLERIAEVFRALALDFSGTRVITVAGTNGKGSCAVLLSSILQAAGYRVGTYTSPHILRYNERVSIDNRPVSDDELCLAFEKVDRARGGVSLTYFEFGTLAALQIFHDSRPDVLVLEVGLGGRLDAVNILDADVAVITSVALDHMDWLGADREAIGREKAGILRRGRCAVYGEADVPASVLQEASRLQVKLLVSGSDFGIEASGADQWSWYGKDVHGHAVEHVHLPRPRFLLANAATAIQALHCLDLQIAQSALQQGLYTAQLRGRQEHQRLGDIDVILDVAHNPAAVAQLARHLEESPVSGKTVALFAAMADKDIAGMVQAIKAHCFAWFVGDLKDNPRALAAKDLAALIHAQGINMISISKNMRQAWRRALSLLESGDRLVVFGSFFTVAEITAIMERDLQRGERGEAVEDDV